MKARYDERTDTLTLILREGAAVSESDEDKPGVILDYDTEGNLVSIEVLDASKRVTEAKKVELELVK
jgi:YD repeat-containing protein